MRKIIYNKIFFIILIAIVFIPLIFVSVYSQEIVTGYVIKIDENLLYFDRGSNDNVRIGDEFKLLRDMPEGRRDKNIGIVQITQIFPEISVGKLTEIVKNEKPSVLDKIEIAPIIEMPEQLKNLDEVNDFLIPIIYHNKITSVEKGKDIDIVVRADAFEGLKDLYVMYISEGFNEWERIDLISYRGDIYFCKIPSEGVIGDTLKYFLKAEDINDRSASLGNETDPIRIDIVSSLFQEISEDLLKEKSDKKKSSIGRLLIPGYTQLKQNEVGKGYMIMGLQSAAILGGFIADKNNGMYFGTAAIIYLYNIFDGIF